MVERMGRRPRSGTMKQGGIRSRLWSAAVAIAAAALLFVVPSMAGEESFPLPGKRSLAEAPSFAPTDRIVATHYFYWYRHPDSHFDQLRLHFPKPESVSYESAAWHREEMLDVMAAGIDVILPVYWGAVDRYDKPDVAFSVRGLPALTRALDSIRRQGKTPPRVGMFYDTTTLLNAVRGAEPRDGRADLRTPEGRDLFYRTIRDFFCQVPPRHWARIGGCPLVVLYASSFSAGYDQRTFDEAGERFARDFGGLRPFVIRDESWSTVRTDAVCSWGAALWGPKVREGTVQIGPGYDDSPVRGRRTPIRDREDGAFYENAWRAALRAGRNLVLVETWNEHHEGTSIAETVEHGRKYIELTARYAAMFKRGESVAGDLPLRYPDPRPRPDRSWGESAKGADEVVFVAGGEERGLRPVPHEDGPFRIERAPDGRVAIRTIGAAPGRATYLYFQVSDWFAFDEPADRFVEVEILDGSEGRVALEYDAERPEETRFRGAYTTAETIERAGSGGWRTFRVPLPRARFANRQNAGSDFRLRVHDTDLLVRSVRLTGGRGDR
jgi:hypothetical protein